MHGHFREMEAVAAGVGQASSPPYRLHDRRRWGHVRGRRREARVPCVQSQARGVEAVRALTCTAPQGRAR